MPFLDDLHTVTHRDADDDVSYLTQPLRWRGKTDLITIPAGFGSDGASVPWYVRWLIPKRGPHTLPAWLHDRLYAVQDYSRRDSDGMFKRALRRDSETAIVRVFLIYYGVRLGGWVKWRRAARGGS